MIKTTYADAPASVCGGLLISIVTYLLEICKQIRWNGSAYIIIIEL